MEQSGQYNCRFFIPHSSFLIEKESAPKLLIGLPKAELSSAGADGKGQKKASQNRTATTTYPCYLPVLGEFSRSWSF